MPVMTVTVQCTQFTKVTRATDTISLPLVHLGAVTRGTAIRTVAFCFMDVVQYSFRAQRTTGTGALVPSDTHGAGPDSLQESVLFVCTGYSN